MGFNEQLNDAANGLMNLFFPRKCPFCGGMVQGKELLCGDCRGTLPFCQEIRRGADFGRCAAPLYYEGRVRDAIERARGARSHPEQAMARREVFFSSLYLTGVLKGEDLRWLRRFTQAK